MTPIEARLVVLKHKRIAVCGGRDYNDAAQVMRALDALLQKHGKAALVIVHGGCRSGADHIADGWCWSRDVHRHAFPYRHDLGKGGGPFRNRQMAKTVQGCVAFPGGRGTADMVACCEALSLKVWWPVGGREETMNQLREGWKL